MGDELDALDAALRSGATVIGGIDPCPLDRDPKGHLDAVFGLAEKHQAEMDIHLHEPGHLGLFSTDLVLERVRALDLRGKVTMSHADDLGSISEPVSRRVIDDFADLDVAMTTVAPSSAGQLSLLGLVSAGVRIGLGEDARRDYWSPYGNCDLLDRTWQLAFTRGFRRDEHIELALAVATTGGGLDHAVMDRGRDRTVLHDGVVVADGLAVV